MANQGVRRRSGAAAAAALLVLLVVALIARGCDGDGAGRPGVAGPELARSFTDPEVGVGVRRPADWTAERRRGAVRLESPDSTVLISISSPARASQTRELLRSSVAALEDQYEDASSERGDGRRIAGLPTRSAVVSGTNERGTSLRVLVATVRGRRRAYLVQVFAARDVGSGRLAEAQAILGSLRLGK